MDLPIEYKKVHHTTRKKARLLYAQLQDNKCWFCNSSLDQDPPEEILSKPLNMKLFPIGFLDHPHHLHHDHNTGLTIGTVHSYCNGVLWQYHEE